MSHAIGDYIKRFPANPPRDPAAARDYWIERGRKADEWGHSRDIVDPSFFGQGVGAKITMTPEGEVKNDLGAAAIGEKLSSFFSGIAGNLTIVLALAIVLIFALLLVFRRAEKAVLA